jgi:cephalosporin hydroxylase
VDADSVFPALLRTDDVQFGRRGDRAMLWLTSRPRSGLAAGLALVALTVAACHDGGVPEREAAAASPAGAQVAAEDLSDQEVIFRFRQLWGKRQAVFRNRFLGISTLQNPLDAWIIQEIISEVRPDVIVEAGTYHGGSAILWAMILENLEIDGRVVTIDIEDRREEAAIDHRVAKSRVDFLLGSSTDPEIVAEVTGMVEGKRVLVILDSLHTADHVRDELAAYAPLVSLGSYIIVQDTMAGSIKAVNAFLEENDSFRADRDRERFVITNTVKGYLRRVR